jgi:hypothetical protein
MIDAICNLRLLVVGDIITDHDIFVASHGRPHTNLEGEKAYEVEQRYTTAGGAAIGARFLAMVNEGNTYLAGFSAPTMWTQALKEIMDQSRIYDNCRRDVKLLCVWTAEGRSPVVSRLVEVDQKGVPHSRPSRWDDSGEVTLPPYKRNALPDLIERVHNESPFDGIIINDLDRGAFDQGTVERIVTLARSSRTPVVVDPKWSAKRYQGVKALALMPNLREWCYLVSETLREDYYRSNLNRPNCLKEIADKSVRAFRDFRYHIITCDADGVILIGPVGEGPDLPIFRVLPVDVGKPLKQGPGDVFAAQFLAAYVHLTRILKEPDSQAVHEACRWGMAAAAAHLTVDWQRMPNAQEVKEYVGRVVPAREVARAKWPTAIIWDTLGDTIFLEQMTTPLPAIFTFYEDYRKDITDIVAHLDSQLRAPSPQALLIGASAGSGKSTILDGLMKRHDGIRYNALPTRWNLNRLRKDLQDHRDSFVVIDEADKAQKRITRNISVVDQARKSGVALVFAGAGYKPELEKDERYAELYTRCTPKFLSPLTARPCDIPVIIAAHISSALSTSRTTIPSFEIEGATIDHAVSQVMGGEGWGPRRLVDYASEIVRYFEEQAPPTGTAGRRSAPRLAHPEHLGPSDRTMKVIPVRPG